MARRTRRRARRHARRRTPTLRKLYRIVKGNRPEVKSFDIQYNAMGMNSVSYGSSAVLYGVAGNITQGTAEGQRVGNRVKIIGLKFDFAVQPGDDHNYFRMFIVRPKSDNYQTGATLLTSILSGASSSGVQWANPIDTDHYSVLYDKRTYLRYGPLDGSTTSTVPSKIAFFKRFIKTRMIFQWDRQNLMQRELVFGAISDSAAVAHPGVVAGTLRVFYTDA